MRQSTGPIRAAASYVVACFIVVNPNAIRVQLPGGAVYAPAFTQAAEKTGARSGLPNKTTKPFSELTTLAVSTLNSGGASMITLEMQVHDDSLTAKLVGKGCTDPTKKLMNQLEALGSKKAQTFDLKATSSSLTVLFEI